MALQNERIRLVVGLIPQDRLNFRTAALLHLRRYMPMLSAYSCVLNQGD